jgi:anti-anti-sigma regulatory factor
VELVALGRFPGIVDFTETPPVLRCAGDEDRSTQGGRRRAMTRAIRAQADVVVDLSELGFADISLMVDLALLAGRLRVGGRAILLRGAQPQIRTLIEMVGIHRLPGVELEGRPPIAA